MKILVASDLHGSRNAILNLKKYVARYCPEMLVLCGDITHMGKPSDYVHLFSQNFSIPILAIPGNCDSPQIEEQFAHAGIISIHGQKRSLGGMTFVGFGGAVYHIFGGIFQMEEDALANSVKPLLEAGCILVLHNPIHGLLDLVGLFKKHVGSARLRELVLECKPRLVLSGHIHEARGVDSLEGITFCNPGPASHKGYAALVEIQEKISVTLLPER